MIRTPVCDLLDIEHPIALGGMGSIHDIRPAGEIVCRIARQAEQILTEKLPRLVRH